MIRYSKYGSRIFLAPPTDASSGGSLGNPASGQGGAIEQGSTQNDTDPTAGINLDDLDPDARKMIETTRTVFATLQKEKAELVKARDAEEKHRKQFQSRHDQLEAQVQKLTGANAAAAPDPRAAQVSKFADILVKRGVDAAGAKVQAEIMAEMLGDFGAELKQQIGRDLGPLANSVVSREAEFAWQEAGQTDKTGALSIPAIQTKVWAQIQDAVSQGQSINAAVVKNLVGMAYYEHLENGGQPQHQSTVPVQHPSNMPPRFQSFGAPGFSSGAQPYQPNVIDPNAARTVLDPSTDAALQVVFKKWNQGEGGIKAPGLRPTQGRGGK